jgi:hypothetical protein
LVAVFDEFPKSLPDWVFGEVVEFVFGEAKDVGGDVISSVVGFGGDGDDLDFLFAVFGGDFVDLACGTFK